MTYFGIRDTATLVLQQQLFVYVLYTGYVNYDVEIYYSLVYQKLQSSFFTDQAVDRNHLPHLLVSCKQKQIQFQLDFHSETAVLHTSTATMVS